MAKVHLCKCNNCDSILEDTNPQVNAHLFDTGTVEPESLIIIDDMKACPFCKTDECLTDIDDDIIFVGTGIKKIM